MKAYTEIEDNNGNLLEVVIEANYVAPRDADRDEYGRATEFATNEEVELLYLEINGCEYEVEAAHLKYFSDYTLAGFIEHLECEVKREAEMQADIDLAF